MPSCCFQRGYIIAYAAPIIKQKRLENPQQAVANGCFPMQAAVAYALLMKI